MIVDCEYVKKCYYIKDIIFYEIYKYGNLREYFLYLFKYVDVFVKKVFNVLWFEVDWGFYCYICIIENFFVRIVS